MSLFNLPVAHWEKPVSVHPWSKIIKDEYSNKLTYAHNSINNMIYPKPKEKVPREKRNRFTVIGNRVTKDFIYCVHLVQGMYKYREKYYEAPVIRGVTGIEWPILLKELQLKYGGISFCLSSQVAVFYKDQLIGGAKELKDLIETRYSYHLALNYQRESVWRFINFIKSIERPCAYFHVSLGDEPIGTLIFMLYSDICPVTCENFLRLCNTTKGGYSGTTIHRIVKDGWIQCGGFGLKNTPMSCENFIVPHDRRGVLGMCNAGRHMDCSTQFFVLLQPSEWMKGRFVAFGQLIDGEQTIQRIEKVPTYYESPTITLTLFKTGILNVDCHDIRINRSANQYIDAHIDDLVAVGEIFYQMLLEHVFLEIEFRLIQRLETAYVEGEAVEVEDKTDRQPIDRLFTKRSLLKKKDTAAVVSKSSEKAENENDDFDVESYFYEPEEYSYTQVTPPESSEPKPKVPFYIPLTDVPYPGEVDSDFNLKRFLQGDYCLLSDLDTAAGKISTGGKHDQETLMHLTEVFGHNLWLQDQDSSSEEDEYDLDSDVEKEIEKCLEIYGEQICFSGKVIKSMALNCRKINPLKDVSAKFTDEQLRRLNLAVSSFALKQQQTGVSEEDNDTKEGQAEEITPSSPLKVQVQVIVKKKSTGGNKDKADTSSSSDSHIKIDSMTVAPGKSSYMKPKDVEDYLDYNDEDIDKTSHHVRIDPSTTVNSGSPKIKRRPTCFVGPSKISDDDDDDTKDVDDVSAKRDSILKRLFNEASRSDKVGAPTLKEYVPLSESIPHNLLLTFGKKVKNEASDIKYEMRVSKQMDEHTFEDVTNLQYGKKVTSKMSEEYVCTLTKLEAAPTMASLRSIEYSRIRPSMTVAAYRRMNEQQRQMQRIEEKALQNGSLP